MVQPSPGFCAIDKGSIGYAKAQELGIVLGENGALWKSADGNNNYAVRMNRFERFLLVAAEEGIKNSYPFSELLNRDAILGHYYTKEKNWVKAIAFLERAIKSNPSSLPSWVYLAESYNALGIFEAQRRCLLEIRKLEHSFS
jgi:tetratricopeptide (TPR) repeat protein